MTATAADILVIGAGIAGASVAAHLSVTRSTIILEMEERPGHHSTGRSAAAFEPNYGPKAIRALTRASRDLYENPPAGFAAAPLVLPRDSLFLMPEGQELAAQKILAGSQGLEFISIGQARKLCPQAWQVTTPQGTFTGPLIINAAGAWADQVASLAGVAPLGLVPKRRSIAVIPPPAGHDVMNWPMITDTGETWYCKPSGGRLLVSPADATPVEPHDAYADDMTLAEGIERFQQALEIEVTHVERTWGGLRTFAPDGEPVCGYDAKTEGFFWLAGQGGYGIQTVPALSRFAAALVEHRAIPDDIAIEGIAGSDLLPRRFRP